jgi:hypothetical protein
MTTIYLGGALVSYEGPSSSHLSKQAREAAYYDQFKPENLCEIRTGPMLTMLAAALIGFVALGSFFSNDATQWRPSATPREAAHPPSPPQPSLAQRFREASDIRAPSKRVELLEISEPSRGIAPRASAP